MRHEPRVRGLTYSKMGKIQMTCNDWSKAEELGSVLVEELLLKCN